MGTPRPRRVGLGEEFLPYLTPWRDFRTVLMSKAMPTHMICGRPNAVIVDLYDIGGLRGRREASGLGYGASARSVKAAPLT